MRRIAEWFERALVKLEGITGIPDIQSFTRDLGKLFLSNRLASVLYTIITIITLRVLGPEQYGVIGLVGNLAAFFIIPMTAGIHISMCKFLPGSDPEQSKKIIGTSWIGILLTTVFWSGLLIGFRRPAFHYLHLSPNIWTTGIVFAALLSLATLAESVLRGQKNYTAIARIRFAGAAVMFILIAGLFLKFPKTGFTEYYFCSFISLIVGIVWAATKSGFTISSLRFDGATAGPIFRYGLIMVVNLLLTAMITSSDLLMVNYFFPGRDLGIYNAYQGFVKNLFTALFFEVFAAVFLPTIAGMDKTSLYQKMNRYIYWLLLAIIIISAMMTTLAVLLFGKEYGLNFTYIGLVSVGIGLYSIFQIYNSLYSMKGNEDAKLCLTAIVLTVPVSLWLQFYLTKHGGITGTMIAVVVTNLVLIVILKLLIFRRYKLI